MGSEKDLQEQHRSEPNFVSDFKKTSKWVKKFHGLLNEIIFIAPFCKLTDFETFFDSVQQNLSTDEETAAIKDLREQETS